SCFTGTCNSNTLTPGAGQFVIRAKGSFFNSEQAPLGVRCNLTVNNTSVDISYVTVPAVGAFLSGLATFSLLGKSTLQATDGIQVRCQNLSGTTLNLTLNQVVIEAQRVGALH